MTIYTRAHTQHTQTHTPHTHAHTDARTHTDIHTHAHTRSCSNAGSQVPQKPVIKKSKGDIRETIPAAAGSTSSSPAAAAATEVKQNEDTRTCTAWAILGFPLLLSFHCLSILSSQHRCPMLYPVFSPLQLFHCSIIVSLPCSVFPLSVQFSLPFCCFIRFSHPCNFSTALLFISVSLPCSVSPLSVYFFSPLQLFHCFISVSLPCSVFPLSVYFFLPLQCPHCLCTFSRLSHLPPLPFVKGGEPLFFTLQD